MRILSGVQPSGSLHLGNYLGAIRQFVSLQDQPGDECYYFVARGDDHSRRQDAALAGAAGRHRLPRSRPRPGPSGHLPAVRGSEVTELAWILSTVTPMGLLQRGHSYKDKLARGIAPTHGLFAYPVLMAADVLIVQADRVPVGRDQKQHLEMTRDIAGAFNSAYGEQILRLPEPVILPDSAVVPGIDGQKMSKSYGNAIELFAAEDEIRRAVMSIVTDSTPLEAPKPTRGSTLYSLLKMLTPVDQWPATRRLFTEGGHGYGEIKSRLLALILDTFRAARRRRDELLRDPAFVDSVLRSGAERARGVAGQVMAA